MNNREKVSDAKPVNGNMNTRNALIEQRRALGLCFQCGDKFSVKKIKVHMLVGSEEGEFEVGDSSEPVVEGLDVNTVPVE